MSPNDCPSSRHVDRPVVGLTADRVRRDGQWWHHAGEKYIDAIVDGAGATALLLPALAARQPSAAVLDQVDGLLFTGSPSNIEPHRYGAASETAVGPHDAARDTTNLALLRAAIVQGVPLLAICRGLQELNVALGGTLHPAVHEVDGLADHREDEAAPLDVQYGPAHRVRLAPGGWLHTHDGRAEATVNSVHGQGIARLADGLLVEAIAPDGLVEAVRVGSATAFTLGVQWHPEWRHAEDRLSTLIFRAFGDACRLRRAARRVALRCDHEVVA